MSNLNWQKIYKEYSPKLLGICRRYIQDLTIAEDIVQDSFITAIQKSNQLSDEKALFAWLKKIVVNNVLQYIRKHSKDTFITTEPSEIPDAYSEIEHYIMEEKSIFNYDFTSEELLRSIDSLPPHHKSVFNLYCIENHSHAEISNLLGISVNTSKSHLLRAKKAIQNYLINQIVNQNTPKNRQKTAQLLVLLGFSGLLWAQTFRNKFSDFKISPSQSFKIPENITVNQTAFSYSDQIFRQKIIIVTILLITLGSAFVLNKKSNHSIENIQFVEKAQNRLQTENKTEPVKSIPISENIKSDLESNHKSTLKQPVNKNENAQKLPQKDINTNTAEETSEKVIIIKKIIKRDTVFIER